MDRITDRHLAGMLDRLNRAAGTPRTYMTEGRINVGHFHLDRAYGGCRLVQTVTEGGGVRDVTSSGYGTKRECYEAIHAFIAGIEYRRAA